MSNFKLKQPYENISNNTYMLKRKLVAKHKDNDDCFHEDYYIDVTTKDNIKIVSYDLFYRKTHNGNNTNSNVNVVIYQNFNIHRIKNIDSTLYFKEIHIKELKSIKQQNSFVKESVVDKCKINEIFYWQLVGYTIDGNLASNEFNALKRHIIQKLGDDNFEAFKNLNYNFIKECDRIIREMRASQEYNVEIEPFIKTLQSHYYCSRKMPN